jgi:hypothetical protein
MSMKTDAHRHHELVDKHAPAAPGARRRGKRRHRVFERSHDISGAAASSMIRQK